MYPVKLGHDVAVGRIERLLKNGHHAEALVTCVFTVEKVLRRTLKELIVSAGFTSKATNILANRYDGLKRIQDVWRCFDPNGDGIPTVIGNQHWQHVPQAVTMRNKLVHGERAYSLAACEQQARQLLQTLRHIETAFQARYGYSGWRRNSVRLVSNLHVDPRVKMPSS